MQSKNLVDLQIKPLIESFPPMTLAIESLPEIRVGLAEHVAAMQSATDPLPVSISVSMESILIAGPEETSRVRVLVYRPTSTGTTAPAILHIHGGGYFMGTPEMSDLQNRQLVAELGCVIVSVDYRLAPETKFPGPVEDCYSALKWLKNNAQDLKIDPTRIGVKGESAGGGLAAAVALLARDRGEIKLAFQHLIYPMIDDRVCVTDNPHPFAGEFIWTPMDNVFGWSTMLNSPPGAEGVSPYAAAARAKDLSGLPPTFISVGALDLFMEENIEYARRLSRVGVPVELHVYPGAVHGFDLVPHARVAMAAQRDSKDALQRAMSGDP
jgi:triacylglycerol lipase